jgi:CBS domain-containing protein
MRGPDQAGNADAGSGNSIADDRLSAAGSAAGSALEVVRFLAEHPPFEALEESDVERVASVAEVEFHRAGTTIFSQGSEPVEHLRVIRSGAVEIVHDGRVLDLLGEGELFGHASMLSGLPTGFEARAAEDTLCYRIPSQVAKGLLSGPEGLRYVARSLLEAPLTDAGTSAAHPARDPAHQPVGSLLRGEAVVCRPDTSIREAAQMMTDAGRTSIVIDLGDGSIGILTDRDLRTRVVANGIPGEAPVSAAMSAPAYTCRPDQLGGEVLLDMLDRGFRHFPVVSATGRVLGVISDLDLVAVQTRSSFYLRQAIAAAKTPEEVAVAARELSPALIAMQDARIAASNITAVYAVVLDVLTRRLVELAVAEAGEPLAPFSWLALGSQARREATPASDMDSAIAWMGDEHAAELKPYLHGVGVKVVAGLEACGFHRDEHGATAADLLFVRSIESWRRAARSLIADPAQEKALILVSVLVDSRPVWGLHMGAPVSDAFRIAPRNPDLLRLLARFALSYRPPTGFLRGLVVEHSGEHRGQLDLKRAGIVPIVGLARWAGMAAGVTSGSTTERLRAAAAAGTLPATDAHTLEDAFELVHGLRLEHQIGLLRAGRRPDDYVDPARLSPLTRTHLREAFRAVASIQKRVAADLQVGIK